MLTFTTRKAAQLKANSWNNTELTPGRVAFVATDTEPFIVGIISTIDAELIGWLNEGDITKK